MPDFISPITESHTYNNFSMREKTPVAKINLRGDLENKDFVSRAGKILGMILPKEACSTSTKEQITCMWLGPNEWLLVSNDTVDKKSNEYKLEEALYKDISKANLGAVTNVSDHYTIFNLTGSNIFEILSKGSPFNFDSETFGDNKVIQTILNHVDITIHRKSKEDVDLYVRRSFSDHLWAWIKDSSRFA